MPIARLYLYAVPLRKGGCRAVGRARNDSDCGIPGLWDGLEIPGEAAKLAPLDAWLAGDIPAPVSTRKCVSRGGGPKALLAIE